MQNKINERIEVLSELKELHLVEAHKQMQAANNKIVVLDMITIPVYNRSMSLLEGFILLVKSKNFICAAPLIRLQLDNFLRLFASSLVENLSDFVIAVLDGEKISNFRDAKTNKRLFDHYLVLKASEFAPWIDNLYRETSGCVHFSSKHIFNSINKKSENDTYQMKVSKEDEYISEEFVVEALDAMIATTKLLLTSLSDWTKHKNKYYSDQEE